MLEKSFDLRTLSGDSVLLYGTHFEPETSKAPGAVVVILHGMGEHSARYQSFARFLSEQGYAVFCYDQRGHGVTGTRSNSLSYLGKDGFRQLVRDAEQVVQYVRSIYLSSPVVLFGHSLGSFVAQSFITHYGPEIDACILCGSNGPEGRTLLFGQYIAKRFANKFGVMAENKRLTQLTFGLYNRHFRPYQTPYDWLSRDADEVSAFISDNKCGFSLSAKSMHDMFVEMYEMFQSHRLLNVPKDLPIHIISGTDDPVGHMGRGIRKLLAVYRKYGLRVTYQLYPGARHELLHEINRNDVYSDVISWLNLLYD